MIRIQIEKEKYSSASAERTGAYILQFTKDNKYATYVNATNVYSDKTVDLSQWQHVMATYNKDTKKIAFYINGEKDSEKDAGNQVVNELTNLLIGRHKMQEMTRFL